MLRPATALLAALVLPVAAGCGGGGSGGAVASPATTTAGIPSAPASAPGGFVGDIDRARVVAVCTDLRQASELVGTGLANGQTRQMLLAAADLLERPPRVRSALVLASRLRTDVRAGHASRAVAVGLAWCRANNG